MHLEILDDSWKTYQTWKASLLTKGHKMPTLCHRVGAESILGQVGGWINDRNHHRQVTMIVPERSERALRVSPESADYPSLS